ncbi:MAG TPA: plastocyanin/azurin family copper-binding protein [Candidatus Thermoplasmatota archaeon]|nr:plastocyanin/azurin family copper-binding protein [Candidatus Thermoplasmatota archaeon]
MRPNLAIPALALALALVFALAGSAHAQGQRYEHMVYLHEYTGGLHIVPEQINAKVGDTLVLTVINQGASPHNLRVCGDTPPTPSEQCQQSWGQTKFNVAPDETVTLTVENIPKAGTFEYYCYVPGHKGGGMVGTLIVQGGEESKSVPALGAAGVAAGFACALALRRKTG